MTRELAEAARLGLDRGRARRILDIGTGPGYFPFVLRRLGHTVIATERERDESLMWGWWRMPRARRALRRLRLGRRSADGWLESAPSLYRDVADLLGVERVVWTVEADAPAPALGPPFDLVCARALYFDQPTRGAPRWDAPAWRFFLGDVGGRLLAPGGRLLLTWAPRRAKLGTLLAVLEGSAPGAGNRVLLDRADCLRLAASDREESRAPAG